MQVIHRVTSQLARPMQSAKPVNILGELKSVQVLDSTN